MKAIVNTGPGQLELQDLPMPAPGPHEVRIRTSACGICATDLEMIDGWERTSFPSIPGHEWSGTIDAVGAHVDKSLVGTPCVGSNVLDDGGEVGFEHPGAYASYFITSAKNIHTLPPSYCKATATAIEPLAVTVRALRRLSPEDMKSALILGDGPIGLLSVLLLRRLGVESLSIVGGRDHRLKLARKFGATTTLNYHGLPGNLSDGITDNLGTGFPNIVEATGSDTAIEASLSLVAPQGKVLVVGEYGEHTARFKWNHLLHKELSLIGSNASEGAWEDALVLAKELEKPLAQLITHRFPATQFDNGIALVRDKGDGLIKAVLQWEDL